MKIFDLKTEYKSNPIGIETSQPRLSWKLQDSNRNVSQNAYRIKCATSIEELEKEINLLWDTGKVESDQSIHIEYNGNTLASGQRVYWQVKAWSNKGEEAEWCKPGYWEMGLLNNSNWIAKWIEPEADEDPNKPYPSPLLRKEFNLNKKIKQARVYITCHGLYQLNINGRKVGDEYFTPGWTSYHKRLQYQVYDVTEHIQSGNNAVGVILGDGWYRGPLVWQGEKNLYGEKSALLFQMKVTFEDGTKELILSDKSWKTSTEAIIKSEIYDGEIYDARLEKKGWDEAGFDDSSWQTCTEKCFNSANLVASEGSPVRITETINPVKKITTPKGEQVFDFGQNMVGWISFRLQGNAGEKITIHHAEVLDKDGNFYTDNLRAAKQEIQYFFKGDEIEEFQPHFTFMGFRYIRISDYFREISLDDISGNVIHSDMEPIGDFTCSDPMVNRLQKNIQWGLRGNFLDVPTDCPQRNERLGWTGDAQVFAPTACFNMNAANFFTKWMKDVALDQREDGSVPWVVPNVVKDGGGTGWSDGFGATGWADVAVTIPWEIYQSYGDERILQVQCKSIKAWVDYMIKESGDSYIFDTVFHFGDWLSFAEYSSYIYNAPDYGYAGAHTDKDLIATAYFYYSTGLLQKIASILGKNEDAKKYAEILPKIKQAFRKEFITSNGRLASNTQTAYVIALSFGIMPDEFIKTASERLAADVNHFQHLTTGFLGTPLLNLALTDFGHPELAYKLLFNTKYPSWLYPITMGATTIWERWDGIKPDGTFQDVGMNSFNHYAYGAVGKWLYSRVAGIQSNPENPGFKKIIIKPVITHKLTFAEATYNSMYGNIKSRWEVDGNILKLNVVIPVNTTAIVYIPSKAEVLENSLSIKNQDEMNYKGIDDGYTIVEVGSGEYEFETGC